jgi:hypothetical protein
MFAKKLGMMCYNDYGCPNNECCRFNFNGECDDSNILDWFLVLDWVASTNI